MKRKSLFASLILAATILAACSSNEIGESKDVNQDKIYMAYFISHEEGDENVDITCQFRFAGNAGTTLVLNDSSKVELDGEKLKVDSSTTGGAYYSTHKPVSGFYGRHIIGFTNTHGKRFDNDFIFSPFTLTNTGNATGGKNDLTITYQSAPLSEADHVEVYSTDTDSSFHYNQAGPDTALVIPANELKRQKAKNLSIKCKLYREIELKQSTSEGGSIRIQQELKPVKIKLFP